MVILVRFAICPTCVTGTTLQLSWWLWDLDLMVLVDIWRSPKKKTGVPPVIIRLGFPRNHPAMGVPPWLWKSPPWWWTATATLWCPVHGTLMALCCRWRWFLGRNQQRLEKDHVWVNRQVGYYFGTYNIMFLVTSSMLLMVNQLETPFVWQRFTMNDPMND